MPYALPHYVDSEQFPDEPAMWRGVESCTAQDYTLAVALDVESNHDAQRLVVAHLEQHDPELAARVEFDSEYGCFFAHTTSKADMEQLVAHVADMVAAVNPSAVPGDMSWSPAFIRNWQPPAS